MNQLRPVFDLAGRLLIATIFILSGFNKIGEYDATRVYMASHGVPGALLPLVILLEIGGGLLIIIGLRTRMTAIALACFTLLATWVFHAQFSDQTQVSMLLKNLAIAGGLLLLVAYGPNKFSIDHRRHLLSSLPE